MKKALNMARIKTQKERTVSAFLIFCPNNLYITEGHSTNIPEKTNIEDTT